MTSIMKELIVEKGKVFLFYKIDELFLHFFAVLLFNHSGNLVPAFSYMVRTESDQNIHVHVNT